MSRLFGIGGHYNPNPALPSINSEIMVLPASGRVSSLLRFPGLLSWESRHENNNLSFLIPSPPGPQGEDKPYLYAISSRIYISSPLFHPSIRAPFKGPQNSSPGFQSWVIFQSWAINRTSRPSPPGRLGFNPGRYSNPGLLTRQWKFHILLSSIP